MCKLHTNIKLSAEKNNLAANMSTPETENYC